MSAALKAKQHSLKQIDTLAAERKSAVMYQRLAKAENTRIAYRAAVRAWCAGARSVA